jgi:hypothetical protein
MMKFYQIHFIFDHDRFILSNQSIVLCIQCVIGLNCTPEQKFQANRVCAKSRDRSIMADTIWKSAPNKALKIIKPIAHYGFVPLILYIALKQEKDLTYVVLRRNFVPGGGLKGPLEI